MLSFIFTAVIAAFALIASASNTPLVSPQSSKQVYCSANNLNKLAELMPKSTLPLPSASLELKYVLLGIGTQNYTCNTGDESTTPGTTGAVAQLYDIGTSLNSDRLAQWKISSISCLAFSLRSMPRQLDQTLQSQGFQHIVGHHFFSVDTPIFALDQLAERPYPVAHVSKQGEIDAPRSCCPGDQAAGVIKWLYLQDTTGISRGGIDTVYRIETAGGNKPSTCKGQKSHFEVAYTAQYWVFGPKKSVYCGQA
ncbi:hypothetical protein BKA66DRAFT_567164 [Pyrenochaeta sp. MPI-SDFR-AT-0127]|nr:hypothetical protein BKA66DRAFT_567164 [Pyrenochaeta sp. MPI-SDFR-AT-0127]